MKWYWYVAKSNEIFLDLDSGRSITRALSVLRRTLSSPLYGCRHPRVAMNRLEVSSVWMYPSVDPKHAHLIVVLRCPLPLRVRVAWGLWMGGDQLRAAYVLERERHLRGAGGDPCELLATRAPYGFRAPDDSCSCMEKHKPKSVTDSCPALTRILGDHRSDDYFPRNKDRVRRPPVRFAWGRIPLSNLRAWRSNA